MNKGIMKNTKVGIFFIVLSLIYMLGTSKIVSFTPFGNRGLDSKSIPQMLGILMLVLASLQIAVTVQQNKREIAAPSKKTFVEEEEVEKRAAQSIINRINPTVAGCIALLLLYVAVYARLGFILSTLGYLIFSIALLTPAEKRKKMMLFIVPFAILFTVAIYALFTRYLTLFLPSGVLG